MIGVWSNRPHILHLGLFIVAYVLGCGFAQLLAIVPGTGISIWAPGGIFMATLILAPAPSWPRWVLAGFVAEIFSNFLWFQSPLPAAVLIYAGNALEAMVGAWLVNRTCGRPVRLESLQEVLAFVVLGAGIAPVVSATVGSATLAWFDMQSQTFTAAWPLWWIGDATGILIVAPLALVVLQNWHGRAHLSAARWAEAFALGLIFLGVAALSLSGYVPFAFIIMPPLLWAAVRFEFKGAVVTLTLLALITAIFTISGASEFAGDPESQRHRQMMLQLFLAISAFSALIVAAISRQHQVALLKLRQSVEALRERERELAHLVDMVPSNLWRLNPDGEPTFFNRRLIDFFGLDIADADKQDTSRLAAILQAVVHPDDAARLGEALNHSLLTGERFSMRYRLRRADGVYRWMAGIAEPMRDEGGRIVQWYGLSHDIDDQLHAEEALRQSERQLQQLIDTVPVLIFRSTPDGNPVYANRRLKDFHGFEQEDFDVPGETRMARSVRVLVHQDDRPAVLEALLHSFETGEPFAMRYRQRRRDGVYRWIEGRAEPLRDENGVIVQWYGVNLDIDDQMRAEAALQESQRQLQQMIDAVPVRIWSTTRTGGPVYFNKRYQDYFRSVIPNFEALEERHIENLLQELVHPEDAPEVERTLRKCFDTGNSSVMRFRWREKDAAYRWAECRVEPWRDQDGAVVRWYGVSIDIDDEVRAQGELRLAQASLARASQAASLAELSASIAHEVNQPLAAVVANSHACQRWLAAEPPNIERAKITAERIIRDANSAADVVSRIRALFKQSTEARSSAMLGSVIAEARNLMAEEAMRRSVRIDVDVESNLPLVTLDRIQIQQVLINLIRNGMDAMDSNSGDKVLSLRARRKGDVVQTEISDLGRGIEAPDRIFEPFFTTKEDGMGMGLAVSRSIVESHGGRLWGERNEPYGATFVFTLPAEAKAAI